MSYGFSVAASEVDARTPSLTGSGLLATGKQDSCNHVAHESCGILQSSINPKAPTRLPTATGPCPDFHTGKLTFKPRGTKKRKALVWMGPKAKARNGPLVFYFQGTGMSPKDALWSIGKRNVREIEELGGLVVAPYPDKSTEYPWFIANGDDRENDLLMIDEIVACAIKRLVSILEGSMLLG